jgi:deoxyribodipyrimidine photo-lyase
MEDNAGLFQALKDQTSDTTSKVQPLFIFETDILDQLNPAGEKRVAFLHQTIEALKKHYQKLGSDLWVYHGKPLEIFKQVSSQNRITAVYTNHDYEPAAIKRDQAVEKFCQSRGIRFLTFKDQVIFEKSEILTGSEKPYTVYTPYKKKWLASLSPFYLKSYPTENYFDSLHRTSKKLKMPTLESLGFKQVDPTFFPQSHCDVQILKSYAENRDFPALDATSRLGLHLRFGTRSVRQLVREARTYSDVWLSELIWREFFMQILFHFPHVEKLSFRPEYEEVAWRNNKADFEKWCWGETGYPLVDAGMRQLNATGFMHNRVRMVTASFLTKHLLMHWSKGERYFAAKLLDYELASNNGNWQWAAGTGCDAAPYFRVFNPQAQMKRFDPEAKYVRKWVPEWESETYPKPMIDHREARDRALRAFFKALKGKKK